MEIIFAILILIGLDVFFLGLGWVLYRLLGSPQEMKESAKKSIKVFFKFYFVIMIIIMIIELIGSIITYIIINNI